jgi:hypothetical protein
MTVDVVKEKNVFILRTNGVAHHNKWSTLPDKPLHAPDGPPNMCFLTNVILPFKV